MTRSLYTNDWIQKHTWPAQPSTPRGYLWTSKSGSSTLLRTKLTTLIHPTCVTRRNALVYSCGHLKKRHLTWTDPSPSIEVVRVDITLHKTSAFHLTHILCLVSDAFQVYRFLVFASVHKCVAPCRRMKESVAFTSSTQSRLLLLWDRVRGEQCLANLKYTYIRGGSEGYTWV